MVNMTLWLSLITRPRDSFVAHGHAMPISTTFIEDSGFIEICAQRLHAASGGSSVPISRGSPPLYSR
jgi:hypothetical protein